MTSHSEIICPVCGLKNLQDSHACVQCGWDFTILLGTPKQVGRHLQEARTAWYQHQNANFVLQLQRSLFQLTSHLAPRPDCNGILCRFPNRTEVYLIDLGCRRHIQNVETFNNLFRDWGSIIVNGDFINLPEVHQIQSNAILSKGDATDQIYLIDHYCKRHITSPAIMDKYHFA